MGNIHIYHRKITVIVFVTLDTDKIIAVLVEMGVWEACPPVG